MLNPILIIWAQPGTARQTLNAGTIKNPMMLLFMTAPSFLDG
jgi:hypothetical protein